MTKKLTAKQAKFVKQVAKGGKIEENCVKLLTEVVERLYSSGSRTFSDFFQFDMLQERGWDNFWEYMDFSGVLEGRRCDCPEYMKRNGELKGGIEDLPEPYRDWFLVMYCRCILTYFRNKELYFEVIAVHIFHDYTPSNSLLLNSIVALDLGSSND